MIRDFNSRKDAFAVLNRISMQKLLQAKGIAYTPAGGAWVLLTLKLFNNNKTSQCYPTQATISEATGMCPRTVRRIITTLVQQGIIIAVNEKNNRYFFPLEELEDYFLLQQKIDDEEEVTTKDVQAVKENLMAFERFMNKQGDKYAQAWSQYKSQFIDTTIFHQIKIYQIAQNF